MGRNGRRLRVEPTDEWERIELLCGWPEQRDYELIHPLVLFGGPASERAEAYRRILRILGDEVEAVRRVIRTGREEVRVPELCVSHGWRGYRRGLSHPIRVRCLHVQNH